MITVLDSSDPSARRAHVFIRPLRPGLVTNLTLTTNRRSYHLELESSRDATYTAAVEWQYPLDDFARQQTESFRAATERQNTTLVSGVDHLRFDYDVQVVAGGPSWKPVSVCDDGQKTFIRFAHPMGSAPAPALFVLRSGTLEHAAFVNYRVKSDLYVVEGVLDVAELRLSESGGSKQDVVRITRHP